MAHGADLFAAFSWGMNIPLTTVLFRTIDAFALAPLRVAAAAAALAAIALATLGPGALRLPIAAGRLALMTLAMASFFTLYNLGLQFTNTITAAALMAGGPVYAALTLRVATGQRLEPGFWGAAVLTLLGGGLAVWGRASTSGQGLVLQGGEPLIVLSTVCWTLYSVYSQRWFDPRVPQLRRTFASLAGSVGWLLLVWAGGARRGPGRAAVARALRPGDRVLRDHRAVLDRARALRLEHRRGPGRARDGHDLAEHGAGVGGAGVDAVRDRSPSSRWLAARS